MRLSKRQLKRIIREEYSRLKRRGLIKESMAGNPIEALCDDMEHCDAWYEYMYETSTKGSEVELVDEEDLAAYGFDQRTIEAMMYDKMEFEETCEMDLGMRIGRCWDNFFAIMDRREGEGYQPHETDMF